MFIFDRWMDKERDDGDVLREMNVVKKEKEALSGRQ